jgi:MFS family permease
MNTEKHLENLNEIKQIMDRSTRFLSLSGLSGIMAGVSALVGAVLGYFVLYSSNYTSGIRYFDSSVILDVRSSVFYQLLLIGFCVLASALFFGFYFTYKKAKKEGQTIWNKSSKKMILNMAVPLVVGGVFSLILISYNLVGLVAPVTLIFYGLACVNASQFTHSEIGGIGYFNILLGLLNAYFIGYGIVFWALGFGVLHIVYGTLMYLKYDRK